MFGRPPTRPDAEDPGICPECGSNDVRHDHELMRPWIAEDHCSICGHVRRREA